MHEEVFFQGVLIFQMPDDPSLSDKGYSQIGSQEQHRIEKALDT
jgi:hypothetical protein